MSEMGQTNKYNKYYSKIAIDWPIFQLFICRINYEIDRMSWINIEMYLYKWWKIYEHASSRLGRVLAKIWSG